MGVEQGRQRVAALHIAAKLDELPAFAVAHGGVGNALKEVRALLDGAKKLVRLQDPALFRAAFDYLQIELVELLPHLRAALLADVTEVLPRRRHAGNDGREVFAAEDQRLGELEG